MPAYLPIDREAVGRFWRDLHPVSAGQGGFTLTAAARRLGLALSQVSRMASQHSATPVEAAIILARDHNPQALVDLCASLGLAIRLEEGVAPVVDLDRARREAVRMSALATVALSDATDPDSPGGGRITEEERPVVLRAVRGAREAEERLERALAWPRRAGGAS